MFSYSIQRVINDGSKSLSASPYTRVRCQHIRRRQMSMHIFMRISMNIFTHKSVRIPTHPSYISIPLPINMPIHTSIQLSGSSRVLQAHLVIHNACMLHAQHPSASCTQHAPRHNTTCMRIGMRELPHRVQGFRPGFEGLGRRMVP